MLPLFKQKALAKDMTLPFARSLKGLNIRAHTQEAPCLNLSASVTFVPSFVQSFWIILGG
jgi:hypothetical protein